MKPFPPAKKPRPPVPPKPKNYVPKKFPRKVSNENQSGKEKADSVPAVSSFSSCVDHDSQFFVNLEKGNCPSAAPRENPDAENSSQFFVSLDKQTLGSGSARAEDFESETQISSPLVTSVIEHDEETNSVENNKANSHEVHENGVATAHSRSIFCNFSEEFNSGKESPDPLEGLEIEADALSDDQDEEFSPPSHEGERGSEQLSYSERDVNGVAVTENLGIAVKEQSSDSELMPVDKVDDSKENVKVMFSLVLEEECSVSMVDNFAVGQKLVDFTVNETTDFSQPEEGNKSEDINELSNETENVVDHEPSDQTLVQTTFAEPLLSVNEDGENVPQFDIEKSTDDTYPCDVDIVSEKLLEDMQESVVEDASSIDKIREPTLEENTYVPPEADLQLDNLELQTNVLINDTSKELMEDKVEENKEVIMAEPIRDGTFISVSDHVNSEDTAEVAEDKNQQLCTEEAGLDVKEESLSVSTTVAETDFENPTEEISDETEVNDRDTIQLQLNFAATSVEEMDSKNVDIELNIEEDSRDHVDREKASENKSMAQTENIDSIEDTEGLEQVELAKTESASVAETCTVDTVVNSIEGYESNEIVVAAVETIAVVEPESPANKDEDEPQSPSSPEPVPPERKSRKNRQSKHAYENITVEGGIVQTENKKTDSIPRRTQSFSRYETVVLSLPRPVQRVSDDEAIYRVPSKLMPVHGYADDESVYSVPRVFSSHSFGEASEYSVPKPIVVQATAVTDKRKPGEGGEIYAVPGLPTPVPVETFTEHLSKEVNVIPKDSENIYVVPGQQSMVKANVSAVPPPKPPRQSLCLEPDRSEKIVAEEASAKESPKPVPRARVIGDATLEINKRKASPSPVPRKGAKAEASGSSTPEKRASPSPVPRKGSRTSQTTEFESATPPGSGSPVPVPRSRSNALQGNKEAAHLPTEVQSSSEVSMAESTEDEAPKRKVPPPPRPPPPTIGRISIASTEGTMLPPLSPRMESDSDSDVGEEEATKGPPKPKTYHIAHEILSTERTFVDALKLVFEECYGTIKSANVVADSVLSDIFRDLENIYLLDSRFLQELEERMVTWEEHERIGDIIKKYGHFLKMYTQYVNGYDKAMSVFQDTMKENPEFANLVSQFQASERCHGMILSAYMLKPVQRIPSYRLLLIDYLKHLPKDSEESKDTEAALKTVSEVATHINESMKKMDSFEQLLKLQNMLIGHPEIVKAGRDYLREGMLMKLCRKDMQERMFFLLTDVLLYTTPMGANQYKLNKMLPLLGMQVTVPDSPDFVNEFSIISTTRSFTLTASTPEERDDWVEALNNAIDVVTKRKITFVAKTGDASGLLEQDGEGGKLGEKAPVWIPDARVTMCMSCTSPFTLTNRRHHCRACGNVVCGSCSESTAPLVYLNYTEARVCDKCYDKLLREFNKHEINVHVQEEAAASLPPLLQEEETAEKLLRKPTKFEIMRKFKSRKTKRKSQIMHPTHLTEVVANQEGIQMSGYLKFKKGRQGWKKSWFVLKDSVLYSYRASSDVVALDTMPVLGYQIEDLGKEGGEFVFQLKHQGVPPIVFKADNETSAKRWVQELTKATTM